MFSLLIIALILAATWFYSGFFRHHEGKAGALAVFLVLGGLTVFVFDRAASEIPVVEEYVAPYSEELAALALPVVPDEVDQAWSLKATEGDADTASFYRRKQAQEGWSEIQGLPLLTIRHDDQEQVLTIHKAPKTLLGYALQTLPAEK